MELNKLFSGQHGHDKQFPDIPGEAHFWPVPLQDVLKVPHESEGQKCIRISEQLFVEDILNL